MSDEKTNASKKTRFTLIIRCIIMLVFIAGLCCLFLLLTRLCRKK